MGNRADLTGYGFLGRCLRSRSVVGLDSRALIGSAHRVGDRNTRVPGCRQVHYQSGETGASRLLLVAYYAKSIEHE